MQQAYTMELKEGDAAPDFFLPDEKGRKIKLSDYSGQKVVLYFYPKDNTPGCTKEACSFKNSFHELIGKNTFVIGISMDSEESHRKFISKFGLPFTLLSDSDGAVCKKYNVYGERFFMGKSFFGVKRKTFLIDEKGKIMKIFEKVDVERHAEEILIELEKR